MIWGLRNLGKGHSKCKGTEVGTSRVGSRGEASVAEVWGLARDATWGLGDCDKDLEVILRAKETTWRVFHQVRDMTCLRF